MAFPWRLGQAPRNGMRRRVAILPVDAILPRSNRALSANSVCDLTDGSGQRWTMRESVIRGEQELETAARTVFAASGEPLLSIERRDDSGWDLVA